MKANRAAAPIVFLFIAACGAVPSVAPPAPPPAARPAPAPPPPAPPAPAPADWRNAPRTEGNWTWAMEGGRSVARYGVAAANPVAMLACNRAAGTLNLWRTAAAQGPVPVVITSTGTRRMANGAPGAAGGVDVALPASDAVWDAIAFSRGRFMVEVPGNQPLYLPAWPELTRVIEDCR